MPPTTPLAIAPVLVLDLDAAMIPIVEPVEPADAAPSVPDRVVPNVVFAVLVPVLVTVEAPWVNVDIEPVCVVVPSNANALVLNWLAVLTYPGQLVLPITITVVG
jgi:hypothetical protein